MKFLGGFLVGALLTILVFFITGISISDYSEHKVPIQNEAQVQYVDVKGKKGNATLYIGMPKDSVLILVGKPDQVNMQTLGGNTFEDWGYKLKNEYVSDLDITFIDGKLNGVQQY